MKKVKETGNVSNLDFATRVVIVALALVIAFPFNIFSAINLPSGYDSPDGSAAPVDYGTLITAAELPAMPADEASVADSTDTLSRIAPEALDAFPDSIYLSVPKDEPAMVTGDSIARDWRQSHCHRCSWSGTC